MQQISIHSTFLENWSIPEYISTEYTLADQLNTIQEAKENQRDTSHVQGRGEGTMKQTPDANDYQMNTTHGCETNPYPHLGGCLGYKIQRCSYF